MAEKKPLTQMPCEEFAMLASQGFENPVGFRDRLRMLWHKIICVYCRRLLTQMTKIRSLLGNENHITQTRAERIRTMPGPMKSAIRKHVEKSG